MGLATLYKKAKTGKITECKIEAIHAEVITATGYVDGIKTLHKYSAKAKNIHKRNATTAEEQAIKEAKAKWEKQLKKGYTLSPTGETDKKLPRKIKKFQDLMATERTRKNLIFPCLIEDKLNGINSEYRKEDLNLCNYSRGGDNFPLNPVQIEEIVDIMETFNLDSLNGEQYCEGLYLQDIQAAVTKLNEQSKDIVFNIFEFPTYEATYEVKTALKLRIIDYIKEKGYKSVAVIGVTVINSMEELDTYYEDALKRGCEGVVISNYRSWYKYNERSSDVWKRKPAEDAEYKVLDCRYDRYGHAIYVCETSAGKEFSVKRKGTKEERIADAEIASSNIGRWLRVEFEMLSKEGKPQKPVGLEFRECDDTGAPQI